MTNTIRYKIDNIAIQNMSENPTEDTDYVYATGMRGFVRRRRKIADNRRARKDKKIDARIATRTGRIDAKKTTAQSKIEAARSDAAMAKSLSSSPKKSNTGLYIGLGVGALLLIGAAFYLLKKKK